MLKLNRQGGFTLLEILIVTAIIGLLASILIPNLIDALQKARQKRTMTTIRGLGTAWMSWMTDHHSAASAGSAKVYDHSDLVSVSYTALNAYLRPTETFFYAQTVPQVDGWNTPLRFKVGPNDIRFFICAKGRDSTFVECDQSPLVESNFLTTDYDQDIAWAEGYFVRWPDGLGVAPQ